MGKKIYWFKSTPDNFKDEKNGICDYTMRVYDKRNGFDARFTAFDNMYASGKYAKIGIKSTANAKEKFVREITHIKRMILTEHITLYGIQWRKKFVLTVECPIEV